jgi:hypothetical protein
MRDALDTLTRLLREMPARLGAIPDEDASRAPEGRWSAKQIIGHLIDSAGNNHQRWVRALSGPVLEFPKYDQDLWVATQRYADERWPDLVDLWLLYNRHLLHIASNIPPEKLQTVCIIGDNPPATLESLVAGYTAHLKHHLGQILARELAVPAA